MDKLEIDPSPLEDVEYNGGKDGGETKGGLETLALPDDCSGSYKNGADAKK